MQAEFSWSLSRHDTFTTCKRRYFYAYYAAREDPEVHRLKKLSALPLWAGSVVHDVLERLLKERDGLPSPTEQEALVREAVHARMVGDWRDSQQGSTRFRLFEHEYDLPVEPEDKKIAVTVVMRSLRHAFRSPTLGAAFAAGRAARLSVEELVSFHVNGVPVLLRMDLAFRQDDGGVLIVDWKTGRKEGRFNETQLAGYALYARAQGWVRDTAELRTELAYLVLPRFVRRAVQPATLAHARRFVERSAAAMKALLRDPLANVAHIDDFPMIDRPQVCRRCNFRRLCFPRTEAARATLATP